MNYYPLYLNLKNKKCVIIGGGKVAERKISILLRAKAKIYVVSPKFTEQIKKYGEKKEVILINNIYDKKYLKDAFLVFACTNDKELNDNIVNDAKENNILVNDIITRENCDFIVPSIINRGKIIISISTQGSSPALSKLIRKKIESVIGEEYSVLAEILESIRKKLLLVSKNSDKNKELFEEFIKNKEILNAILSKDKVKIKKLIREIFRFEVEF